MYDLEKITEKHETEAKSHFVCPESVEIIYYSTIFCILSACVVGAYISNQPLSLVAASASAWYVVRSILWRLQLIIDLYD